MKNLIIAALVIFLASACGTSNNATTTTEAQRTNSQRQKKEGQPSIDDIFKMDTNNDGKLSINEVKGPLQRDFSKIDADGDGFITRIELENAPKPQRGQRPSKNQ